MIPVFPGFVSLHQSSVHKRKTVAHEFPLACFRLANKPTYFFPSLRKHLSERQEVLKHGPYYCCNSLQAPFPNSLSYLSAPSLESQATAMWLGSSPTGAMGRNALITINPAKQVVGKKLK